MFSKTANPPLFSKDMYQCYHIAHVVSLCKGWFYESWFKVTRSRDSVLCTCKVVQIDIFPDFLYFIIRLFESFMIQLFSVVS